MVDWSEYWAHSPNEDGNPQLMDDHLRCVAEMAGEFAARFGAEEFARRVGWLHDIGKFSDQFQKYLRRCHSDRLAGKIGKTVPGGGDHKWAGARYASRLANRRNTEEAFLILGHHGGMPARTDLEVPASEHAMLDQVITRALQQIPDLQALPDRVALPASAGATNKDILKLEFFLRMVFSCLADADSLDTERHFNLDTHLKRDWNADWNEWRQRLTDQQERFQEKDREQVGKALQVAQVRREVYEQCDAAGRQSNKAFSLAVPTGGGKTLSSLAFALSHIFHSDNRLERIIYAIPYTSIIDQTASVFQNLLGKDAPILVHHSALPDDKSKDDDGQTSWRRLASQNWDAPLIVTTTVQLFESLFSNSPGRCRKLHNLANSVIILDEAQMLPIGLLAPILDGLKLLVRYYGASIVFCTATQPAFDTNSPYHRGFREITPIIPPNLQSAHFQIMQRVNFWIEPEAWTWDQAAEAMRSGGVTQCLSIVNTRANALALLDALNDPHAFHLSTLLCGAHREQVLVTIRERLKQGEPCRLVATQVVECGVDLDFPRVLRAIGPLDRMVQAAGRCNREGLLASGEVIFFLPAGGSLPPGEYATAVQTTLLLLKDPAFREDPSRHLHDPAIYRRYFEALYGEHASIATDKYEIQKLRRGMDYPEVAKQFRMIDQDTLPVLVCYEPERARFDRVLNAIQQGRISRSVWRQAQPLLVNLYTRDIQAQLKQGQLEELIPDALYLWKGDYDAVTHRGLVGITSDPADAVYAPDKLIS